MGLIDRIFGGRSQARAAARDGGVRPLGAEAFGLTGAWTGAAPERVEPLGSAPDAPGVAAPQGTPDFPTPPSATAPAPDAAASGIGEPPAVPAVVPENREILKIIDIPAVPSRRRDAVEPVDDLERFIAEPHFAQGWHAGRLHRTRQALDLGRREMISRYCNTLARMIEHRQAQADRLADSQLMVEGVSEVTSRRLAIAIAREEREIRALRDDMTAALEGRGRVAEPLARYENGFTKGLNDALAAELIGLVERPR